MKRKIAISILLFLPVIILAQETPEKQEPKEDNSIGSIATDRPVQSETPTVVPKKHLQFEQGAYFEQGPNYTSERRTSDDLLAYNMLAKYGLIKNLELRFNFDYFTYTTMMMNDFTKEEEKGQVKGGVNAPLLGLKYSILQQKEGWMPNLVVSATSQFDWYGREDFQPEAANVKLRMTAGKNITSAWYVLGGIETNFEDGNSDATGHFYVFQTGYSIENLTLVAEIYGNRNYNIDLNQNAVNGALVYLLNDNHQFDLSGGWGLSNNFYSFYAAVGYSVRFGL